MVEDSGFVLIGAGLPRTGTLSTRAALQKLLHGNIYHMSTVVTERPDHHPFWWRAIKRQVSPEDWRTTLSEYRAGVDYPVSFYYKEIMEAYPNAKVLLNVRDPVKWYQSVKNSILKVTQTTLSWPVTWFSMLAGSRETFLLVDALSSNVPGFSKTGLGMFGSVADGEATAVQFFNDHVNEVKSVVPADRLLVWEVKEGWEPLCKFLGVPVPDEPFPRVNDTAEMDGVRKAILYMSWLMVVFVPAGLAGSAWYLSLKSPVQYLSMAAGYMLTIGMVRSYLTGSMLNHGKSK